jgi:ribosomal-protein-alanine N-acetyltransferase
MTYDDAPALAELLEINGEFLAPWEPVRSEDYFTADGQRAVIQDVLEQYGRGAALPHVITGDGGEVVGRITLNGIVRGAFQSCSVGYWVAEASNGRGFASRALDEIVRIAFGELGLHRVQAETLLDNVRSQRILERNGFVRYGLAPSYLKIAGRWQDFILFQRINPD